MSRLPASDKKILRLIGVLLAVELAVALLGAALCLLNRSARVAAPEAGAVWIIPPPAGGKGR